MNSLEKSYPEPTDQDIQSSPEPLDEKWCQQLNELNIAAYDYLVPDKASIEDQKKKFLDGEIDIPEFNYAKLDPEILGELERVVEQFKSSIEIRPPERAVEIKDKEETEVAKQAYHWRINQLIASVRMLQASAAKDDRKFQRYSEFVFGEPQGEIYQYILEYTRGMITQASDKGEDLAVAAAELDQVLPVMETGGNEVKEPSEEIFEMASVQTKKEVESLLDIEVGDELTDEDIAQGFNSALEKIEAAGWVSKVDHESGRVAISVDSKKKIIHVPENRKMLKDEFYELVAYEIGTHIRRELNGSRSKLRLLGIGLDRNVPGEEGIATMRQQVIEGRIDGFTKHALYLGIGLAYGLDGQKRNFREVYDILERYYHFLQLAQGATPENSKEKAKDLAWTTSVRIFRGTSGQPGVCFTKDLAYMEGNIGVWSVLEKNGEELHRFNVGKYSPMNERHIAILDRLGISDDDLKELN